ncbi:unnamed protein product [Coregonus sp. 'balchen']|nr:unnamed protein product [Coregonus sp. 'balchen']
MFFCRSAWQKLGLLARMTVALPLSRNVRQMSFGIPGGSSTNMAYFVLCGGGLTAAVVYAYKTVNGDSERYNDRLAEMNLRPKGEAEEEAAPEAAAEAVIEDVAEAAPVVVEEVVALEDVAEAPAVEAAGEDVVAETAPAAPEAEAAPAAEVAAA